MSNMLDATSSQRAFYNQLKKVYIWYTGGFLAFCIVLALAEKHEKSEIGRAHV